MRPTISFTILLVIILTCCKTKTDTTLTVSSLKCNGLENPLGTDRNPEFSWINNSSERGQAQTAYQIIVSSSEQMAGKNSGDIWDSGKYLVGASTWISYQGPELSPGKEYFWKVRVWDGNDNPSSWSKTAKFITGLFDGEDWGEEEGYQGIISTPGELDSWWCLGSQYWSKNKHRKNYSASYGILLDMVGARRSQFYREGASMEFATKIVDKVWTVASRIGYSDYFVKQNVPAITDDHVFVNQFARIPMIDIVHYQAGIGFFGDYHHTQKDNMSVIDKETLEAVGATLLHVIYYEQP